MHIATKGSKINISSEQNTEEAAKKIKKEIRVGDTIFFYGEMGVGKTTFIRYLINEFQKNDNEKKTEITSPTFNILNEYQVKDITIKHYDLFRLTSSKELSTLNIFEKNEQSILLIEWPQIIKHKPKMLIELFFEYENKYQNRNITFLN